MIKILSKDLSKRSLVEGKYIRFFFNEDVYENSGPHTMIAKIIAVIPEKHMLVLERLSGIEESKGETFHTFYKEDEASVEIFEEEEAIMLAFKN